jgi:GDP-D-mannose 3',5'-epimerase
MNVAVQVEFKADRKEPLGDLVRRVASQFERSGLQPDILATFSDGLTGMRLTSAVERAIKKYPHLARFERNDPPLQGAGIPSIRRLTNGDPSNPFPMGRNRGSGGSRTGVVRAGQVSASGIIRGVTDANSDDLILVTGAGGFIGGHLIGELRRLGCRRLRAVDIKPVDDWYQAFPDVESLTLDLNERASAVRAAAGAARIYNLACDMGGMGFIETHRADCMLSVLINTHLLMAARDAGCQRYFFASSACVYSAEKQTRADPVPLKEADAYPAMPEDGYGWEKLFGERMCRHFHDDFGLETRVARYHNIYGPHGTYDGGREKVPAAICRKVIAAQMSGSHEIEIWGDGRQARSFTYIDDCLDGTLRLMASDIRDPLNMGSDELVTIDQLVDVVEHIAGTKLKRRYNLGAPQGVRGRVSDNTEIRRRLGWAPSARLSDGMEQTYRWIYDQMVTDADRPRLYSLGHRRLA